MELGSYVPLGYGDPWTGIYTPVAVAAVVLVWGAVARRWAWAFMVGALLGLIFGEAGLPEGWTLTALIVGANVQGFVNFLKKDRSSRSRLLFQLVCAVSSTLIFPFFLLKEPTTSTHYTITTDSLVASHLGGDRRLIERIDRRHIGFLPSKEIDLETAYISGGQEHYWIDKSMVYWHNGRPIPGSELLRTIAVWSNQQWVLESRRL